MSRDLASELASESETKPTGDCGCQDPQLGSGGYGPYGDDQYSLMGGVPPDELLDPFEDVGKLEGAADDALSLLEEGADLTSPFELDDPFASLDGDDLELELADLEANGDGVTLESVLALARKHPGLKISFGF